jgi:hypothetical protein
MRADNITIEERILDTEVDKDRLIDLMVDVMVEDIVKEIRAGKSKGQCLVRPSLALPCPDVKKEK